MKRLWIVLLLVASVASADLIKGNFSDIITKGPWVDVRWNLPAGYVTDGSVDYSAQVQATLDAMSTGQTLVVPILIGLGNTLGGPNKTLPAFPVPIGQWDGLRISGKTKIKILGINGGGFKYLVAPYYHNATVTFQDGFTVLNSSWITVDGIHFDMGGFNAAAFYLDNVMFSSFKDNYIYHHAYDTGTSAIYGFNGTYNSYTNNILDNVSGGIGVTDIGSIISLNRGRQVNRSFIAGNLISSVIFGNTCDNCNTPTNLGANNNVAATSVAVIGNIARNCMAGSNGQYGYAYRTDGVVNDIRGISYLGNIAENCGGGIGFTLTSESNAIGNIFRNIKSGAGISMGMPKRITALGNIITGTPANDQQGIVVSSDNSSESGGYYIVGYNQIYGYDNSLSNGAISTANTASASHLIVAGNMGDSNRYGFWGGGLYDNLIVSNNIFTRSTGASNTWDLRFDRIGPNVGYSNNLYSTILTGGAGTLAPTSVSHVASASGVKVNRGNVAYSDGIPTKGAWSGGDLVFNIGTDNVLGWKCTAGGIDNAAVWKSMTITLEP